MTIHVTLLSVLIWRRCEHAILFRENYQLKNDLSEMRSLRRIANSDSDFVRTLSDRLRTDRDLCKTERDVSRAEHTITKRKLAAARGRITKFKKQVAEWQ